MNVITVIFTAIFAASYYEWLSEKDERETETIKTSRPNKPMKEIYGRANAE